MCKYLFLLFLFFNPFGFVAHGQNRIENKKKLIFKIDSVIQDQIDQDKIPGAVIQIKKNGKIIYKSTYGFAQKYDYNHQLLESFEKMSRKHLFDVASLTKVLGTTTSIMLLVDKGFLRLEDPVKKYISAFDTPEKREITIQHLLTHTSGMYKWYPVYYKASNKNEAYQFIENLPLMFPVGGQRRYSDLGFMLLGEIIEIISNLPLEQFMKQNIFDPLDMKNTTFNPLLSGHKNNIAATSHGNPYEKRMVYDSTLGFKVKEIDPNSWKGWRNYTLKGEVNDGNTWYANNGVSGAAGIFSNIEDIQKLVDMLVNKGKVGSKVFISSRTIDRFLTKDRFENGIGWVMDPQNPVIKNGPSGTFGHTGFTGTSIAVIPSKNISIILLINRQNIGLDQKEEYFSLNSIREKIFETVLQYSNDKSNTKKGISKY